MAVHLIDLTQRKKAAFDLAQDATKQLLTLATGIVALTITFLKDIAKDAPESAVTFLKVAWFLYFLSILCGIVTLMALTGQLDPTQDKSEKEEEGPKEATINAREVRLFAIVQALTFLAAVVLTLVFGVKAF